MNRGFTLVELLVTISIFVILTGVVIFSQANFNNTILLTNLSYDTALTIRQAQTYGVNIKNFTVGTTGNFVPYGVHFDQSADKSFILFADLETVIDQGPDGIFDGPNETCLSDYNNDEVKDGCVNRYNITRGNHIARLCVGTETSTDCDITPKTLDITFVRPSPEAKIIAEVNGVKGVEYNWAKIELGNSDDSNIRTVLVQANGLIEIIHNNEN